MELLVVQIALALGSSLGQARAESLHFFFFFLMWEDPHCPLLPRVHVASSPSPRTEVGIVPCHSPVLVPSDHSSPSPTCSRFQELRALHGWSGLHFPPCWRIKSKQQPQKTCRDWAQVGLIMIFFRFLQHSERERDTYLYI